MSEQEKRRVQEHVNDTLIHKQHLINSCIKMINHLYSCGRDDDALELARRCSLHDHSKLISDEINNFIQLPKESHNKKPNGILTDEQRKLIEIHWRKNRHHPEYFESYKEMNEIDILEMVCDWHSRSKQFHSDFLGFVMSRQKDRFKFDDKFFAKVLEYCKILDSE